MTNVICGIYKITNKTNGKMYVGSSKNIYKRWEEHNKLLKSKKHHNAKLQNAWNKEGVLDLEFSILEECSDTELLQREQYWMDALDTYKTGYNCSEKAAFPTERIKSSIKVKYSAEFDEINEAIYLFKGLSEYFPKEILVSFFGLKIEKASSDTAFIRRFLKGVNLCSKIILEQSRIVRPEVEYRLHYIHYSGKEAEYGMSAEYNESKNSKWSLHNKVKQPDLYNQLWEDLMASLDCCKIGKQIKKNYLEYESSMESC